jgi:hypothetical protein
MGKVNQVINTGPHIVDTSTSIRHYVKDCTRSIRDRFYSGNGC